MDANILETMPRTTGGEKDPFGTRGHGLSVSLLSGPFSLPFILKRPFLTFPLFSPDLHGGVKNAPTVASHAEWPIISRSEGHSIPHSVKVPTHFASASSHALPSQSA